MEANELFSIQNIFTLGGGAFAVTLVGNVTNYVFRMNPRWIGLVTALALEAVWLTIVKEPSVVNITIAFLRALQIYATAVGIASFTGQESLQPGSNVKRNDKTVFWIKWH